MNTGTAKLTPGQAAYEELVRRVGSEYDSWEKLPGDLRAAHEAAAQAAIDCWREIHVSPSDLLTRRIADLRVLLSMLAARAAESGAITEDEAAEWRERGGLKGKP